MFTNNNDPSDPLVRRIVERFSLLQGIRRRLGEGLTLAFTTSTATSDLFEYYIFSLIITAARNEGADIEYRDSFDNITNTLIFRQSPGNIGRIRFNQNYTHARITFADLPPLEAHLGIIVKGRGQVAHECNVCVLHHNEATYCRNNNQEPRCSKVIIAVECKHYATNLSLSLAREFLGFATVLNRLEGDCYFVSNIYSSSVARVLATERKKWALEVIPSSTNNLNKLIYSFQSNFQDFKAKN